jgi:tRNA uridine 5-carboxymethylaminomethyl modification enzyme
VQTCSASIKATGTRYCPSIEDRIMLHPERDRHPIFLQPYGIDHSELYIQGLSTSIPPAAQQDLVRSVAGLESAQIMRPGYAVVYDFIYPDQLYPTLETKLVSGLYAAGQINGTSGYEEAAAQGLIAGINAALKVKGEEPFILDRSQAYIGVLIDDLVTKGVDEPYRMFTSRAEYRLLLRSDNADIRLSKYGYELGLLSEDHYSRVREKETVIAGLVERQKRGDSRSVAGNESGYPMHVEREVEAIILYEGFIDRELKKIAAVRSFEDVMLPDTIDYSGIGSLSAEAVEKLSRIRPVTLAQAMRIPGLRQTDMQVLQLFTHAFHVKRDEEEID